MNKSVLQQGTLSKAQQGDLYRAVVMARAIDVAEEEATRRGTASFQVSGTGHEASAALVPHLIADDWLNCHYRDKAMMIARGVTPREFFDSLYCKDSSHSRGRQLSAFMCNVDLNIASICGPVGNSALHAVGMARAISGHDESPIVVLACGDGSTQEGEFLEAVAEASRRKTPVLFLVEDNNWAISTQTTGLTFYTVGETECDTFHGVPIHRIDGTDILQCCDDFAPIVANLRHQREAQIVVLSVPRLSDHTNSDDQRIYRRDAEIVDLQSNCNPLIRFENALREHGWRTDELSIIRDDVDCEVTKENEASRCGPEPTPIFSSKAPLRTDSRSGAESPKQYSCSVAGLSMRDAIGDVLRFHLGCDHRVHLLGQDIEDPKGDVFGITRGLSTAFPGRVENAALSESTIVGVSIGRAMMGQLPVAMIQFADFIPLAYNQIVNELGSMYWRTDGAIELPLVIMAPCGGYRPGLGPFHASSYESVLAHAPGIDVCMPSNADDAAALLDTALRSSRPTIYFYPKACLNDSHHATTNGGGSAIRIGGSRKVRTGRDITMVAWGNTVDLCVRAGDCIEEQGFSADVIDLHYLSPWDQTSVIRSCERTGRLLVVHEDNKTCGLGAEVLATVAEVSNVPVQMRRLTRADVHVPCNFQNQLAVLPSFRSVLETAGTMVGLNVRWQEPNQPKPGYEYIDAIGTAPSDETVTVVDLHVASGDSIEVGQCVATLEASKGVVDLESSITGTVDSVLVSLGDTVAVGTSLLNIFTGADASAMPVNREICGRPILSNVRPRSTTPNPTVDYRSSPTHSRTPLGPGSLNSGAVAVNPLKPDPVIQTQESQMTQMYMSRSQCVTGGREVDTEEIAAKIGTWSREEAIKRTGIEKRFWAVEGETVVSLARQATRKLIEQVEDFPPIAAVICSTTSPCESSPSIACQVAADLEPFVSPDHWHAFDVNAACSGFLYALKLAYDELATREHHSVVVVTAELASTVTNPEDPATAFLFGDAATATVVTREPIVGGSIQLHRPLLKSTPDDERSLTSPNVGCGYLQMDGVAVARQASRDMSRVMREATRMYDIDLDSLQCIIPHPGSKRILQSVAQRLGVDEQILVHTLAETGNTSSSSIPLAIDRKWDEIPSGKPLGFFAFGAGFTSAATVGMKCD